ARQNDPDFGELAGLGVDLDRAAMLLHDDVVTDGQPKSGAFSRGFRCEEGVEHLLFHFRWNTGAVVANPDFHVIAKALSRGSEGGYEIAAIRFRLALGRCIEAI